MNDRDKWIIIGVCVVCYLIGLYVGVNTKFVEFTYTDEYKEYKDIYKEKWYHNGNYSNSSIYLKEEYNGSMKNGGT